MTSSTSTDTYNWTNAYGGVWSLTSNWFDVTTGLPASAAPGAGSTVTIAGGFNDSFTTIEGSGATLLLAIANDVLLVGTVAVGGTIALGAFADLDLDGGSRLSAASLTLASSAFLELSSSTLLVAGAATLTAGSLLALNASTVQLGTLIANGGSDLSALTSGVIAVDDGSSLEIGTAGGAALGAITIDSGQSAAVTGTIDGNIVLNGALGVQAYNALSVDVGDPFGNGQSISGSGALNISENSLLTLGVADSSAIKFAGPAGTLDLDVLQAGTISGFMAGDMIQIGNGVTALATGLRYTQTTSTLATLTLSKGSKVVGTLAVAGNYAGSLFHMNLAANGVASIILLPVGSAAVQPSLILGTAGSDSLNATANNQTLSGLGGPDILSAGSFNAIDFKDTSVNLNGDSITAFGSTDVIDLTDMTSSTASVIYTSGTMSVLSVTDGRHAATISLALATGLAAGYFTLGTDGASGTDVRYSAQNVDAYLFNAAQGGLYTTASNWLDSTSNTTAVVAPSYGNAVTIAGGGAGYSDVTGNGYAASVTTSGDVLLWGSLTVGSKVSGVSGALTQTGTLAPDGGASLVLMGSASVGGLFELVGGSTVTAAGGLGFSSNSASLLAIGGSSARFASITAAPGAQTVQYDTAVIGVDATSSIEIGAAGNVTLGAMTLDSGVTADLAGTIDGNVVVNGTLVVAGTLAVGSFGSHAPSVSGTGMLELTVGSALSLGGSDSAAIWFSQAVAGSYANPTETLGLAALYPTGLISGFMAGDVITLAQAATSLSYSQSGSTGRLTLLNGSSTVGTLLFSGSYVAGQFQLQLRPDGLSTAITYAAVPSAVAGSKVSGSTDNYSWSNAGGGLWSNAANWTDTPAATTTGGTATAAPAGANAVTISDNPGFATTQIISGSGSAASLSVTSAANTVLTGSITVAGQISVAEFGAGATDVALAGGASLSGGGLNVTSALQVAGGSALTISGAAGGTFISGSVTEAGGSTVQIAGGSSTVSGLIGVDATSSFEFGTSGEAAAGTVTIDAGQALTLQGNATIDSRLVVNGSLLAYAGMIGGFAGTAGAITGTGTIAIGALGSSGSLVLNATDTAALAFQGYFVGNSVYAYESLVLNGPLPTGTISGLITGDTIILNRTITGVTFRQTTSSQGILTLTNGATTVNTLSLGGSYTNGLFVVDVAPTTGVATLSWQAAPSTTGTASASTAKDAYAWAGATGGNWAMAANWSDTTTSTAPITTPSSNNAVTISGATGTGQYTTIGGNGAAASLSVSGNVLLTGQISSAGAVRVSPAAGQSSCLTLDLGAKLLLASSLQVSGRLQLEGASSAAVAGSLILAGGSVAALGGSTVQASALIGNGSGNVIAIDATSVVTIGRPTVAASGTLTQVAGTTAGFNGSIFGSVVANGTLAATGGGALMIDIAGTSESDPYAGSPTLTGTGVLLLSEGSTLGLGVVDSAAIQFNGPNATLLLAAMPTATISGFVVGDQIQVDQPVTGLSYRQTTTAAATLTLTNGATTVGVLKLAGSYGGGLTNFHLDIAANGNTAMITLQSLSVAALQPTLILGSAATDTLIATANGQTLTGLGGNDMLNGGSFTGIGFKDLSGSLNGSTIQNFSTTDLIDFTDMTSGSATVRYSGGILTASDGTHAAAVTIGFGSTPVTGSFHVGSDGVAGTKVSWF